MRDGEVEGDLGFGEAMGRAALVDTAMSGVDHDDLAGKPGSGTVDAFGVAERVGAAAGHDGCQPGERLEGCGSAGAVCRRPDAALELTYGTFGRGSVDAVDPVDLEAELEQPLLQGRYVVADEQVAGDCRTTAGRRAASGPRRAPGMSRSRPHRAHSARAAAGTRERRGRRSGRRWRPWDWPAPGAGSMPSWMSLERISATAGPRSPSPYRCSAMAPPTSSGVRDPRAGPGSPWPC